MRKDPTEFRRRFLAYKEGKMPYENGLPKYEDGIPAYQTFVEEMGPILYKEAVSLGVANPDVAYRNMLTLLAYESNYGTSSVARKLNNYGGVGWNGKTYTTYKNKEDFAKNYVRLMNSRYKNVIGADTLSDYAKGLKKLGYYEDTLENYSRNLTNMKSFARAMDNHFANNKSLYLHTPVQTPVIQHVEPAMSTTVRQTIPQTQTRARWTGAENVSPYLTGKPTVKLNPIIKLPTLELIMDDAEWEPEYNLPGHKNGKLPGFYRGKLGMEKSDKKDLMWYAKPFAWKYITGGLPINTVRERLYNNLVPVSYKTEKYPWVRARDAIVNNEKESFENFDERQRAGALARDEIYAQYLHIPKNKRRGVGFELEDSKYRPTLNDKGEHFYSINFGEDSNAVRGAIINNAMKTSAVLDDGIDADGYSDFYNIPGLLPNLVKASVVLNDLLGWHRVGRAIDPKKGDYVSYWDRWDLTPVGRSGNDLSMGIGTPVNIYDRIYLDDYYGVDSSAPRGTYYGGYLPEVEILPKHKNGKMPAYSNGKHPIHIKPANRGKLTRLKARTGKSESELYNDGNPAHKKMVVFARNARKWKH